MCNGSDKTNQQGLRRYLHFLAWIISFAILIVGCASQHNDFQQEQENYPVFSIGEWFSWNAWIFEDSIVYQRGGTDASGIHPRFPAFTWKQKNDTTITLWPLSKRFKKIYPEELYYYLYDKTRRCQLLIPVDSLDKFKQQVKDDFDRVIVNYKYIPKEEDQWLIDRDSSYIYPQLEQSDFTATFMPISEMLNPLGIWNGQGFNKSK